jgi:hypothetical protein
MTSARLISAAIKMLAALYVLATAATLVFVALERDDSRLVDDAVWTHALLVFGFALLLAGVANRAAKGMPHAYLRLRIISVVTAASSAVLVFIPGLLPTWMKVEQGVYAVALAGLALVAHSRAARVVFARGTQGTVAKC